MADLIRSRSLVVVETHELLAAPPAALEESDATAEKVHVFFTNLTGLVSALQSLEHYFF